MKMEGPAQAGQLWLREGRTRRTEANRANMVFNTKGGPCRLPREPVVPTEAQPAWALVPTPPPRLLCSWLLTSCRPHGPLCALPPRQGPGPTGPVGISAQSLNDGAILSRAAEEVEVIPFGPRPRPLRGHTGTGTCFSSRSQDGLEGRPAASISGDHLQPQSVPFQSAGTWSLYERHRMERLSL